MRQRHLIAALALLAGTTAAQARHFEYDLDLQGTYSVGGTEGCYPPDFNQPACPRDGTLTARMSFDTPGNADGSWLIAGSFGDITNFTVDLGNLGSEDLYGGVSLVDGRPSGSVQTLDATDLFGFDWATGRATFSYDYGYHEPNGTFAGTMSAVSEPATAGLLLLGLGALATRRRRA